MATRMLGWLAIVMLMGTGCLMAVDRPFAQSPVVLQPESPLVSYSYATLAQNNWRVTAILLGDKATEFPTLGPIYINFDSMGNVGLTAINCNATGYQMVAGQAIGRYRLEPGSTTTTSCGAVGNRGYHQLRETVGATAAYEIRGEQLILTGPATQIVAVIDNNPWPTPAAPTPVATTQPQARLLTPLQWGAVLRPTDFALTDKVASRLGANLWQLTTVSDQAGPVDLAVLGETYFTFQGIGYLHLHITPSCGAVDLRLTLSDEQHYQIIHHGYHPDLACSDPINEALGRLVDVVADTTQYELHNDQLVLRGVKTEVLLRKVGALKAPPADVSPFLHRIRWQLAEATQWDLAIDYSAIGPVYLSFGLHGYLTLQTERCNSGGYELIALPEGNYRLIGGSWTAMDCGEVGNAQLGHLSNAVKATTNYVIEAGQLLLTGNGVRLVFAYQQQFPPIPSATPPLFLNRWRWVSITDQGGTVPLDDIQPIYTNFAVGGSLTVNPTDCIDTAYLIVADSDRRYWLVRGASTKEICRGDGMAQFERLLQALEASHELTLQDNQLVLRGDDVQIVLEIDSGQ